MNEVKKIKFGHREFQINPLTLQDEAAVQNLCEACADFSLLVEGRLPEKNDGREILTKLPPEKNIEDKIVLGVFNEQNELVAVIDLIKGYKNQDEWTLGLLMITPSERGHGLGKILHEYIKNLAAEAQAKFLRLGVAIINERAHKFWLSVGYRDVEKSQNEALMFMRYSL